MHALEKALQAHQANGGGQRENGAGQQQQRHQDFGPQRHGQGSGAHSMTSPRSKNLAMAAVPTKPNRAISSAASKYIWLA